MEFNMSTFKVFRAIVLTVTIMIPLSFFWSVAEVIVRSDHQAATLRWMATWGDVQQQSTPKIKR